MKRLALLLLALLSASAALAQNVTVIGPVTPGNVPVFNSTTVIKDSGTTPGGAATVFNVKSAPCNAVGNGVADDTAAINTCIANFNTATKGVLYFPAGTYKTTAALTAITANGIIRGDGATNLGFQPMSSTLPATTIQSTTTSVAVFTINSTGFAFYDLAIQNTSGGTPTSGSTAILVSSTGCCNKVDYENLEVFGFNIGIDIKEGQGWSMHDVTVVGPVVYGVRINNIVNADAGDWDISNSAVYSVQSGQPYSGGTSGLRIEGSGGGKIVNFKCNANGAGATGFANCIDVVGAGVTIDLFIANGSLENFTTNGITISGSWPQVTIMGLEIGSFVTQATPSHAINVANTSDIVISGITLSTGFTGTPINFTNCVRCYVSGIISTAGTPPFSSGTKPDHDGTGGIGTFFLVDGTVATESRIDWHVPAGQYGEHRILLDPAATTKASAFETINDAGTTATFQIPGSASTDHPSTASKALFSGNLGVVVTSDDTGNTGGSDDISLRAGGYSQEALLVQSNGGHINFTGQSQTAPTVTAGCNGAGSGVVGTDTAGTVTGQTAVSTTCTLTFGHAFASVPFCVAVGNTAPLTGAITPATGTLVVNYPSTASFKWTYQCFGK